MEFEGRHALVTGGGTGIGLAIAGALAERGAEVTISGRDLGRLERVAAARPRLHPLRMDVADEASVRDGIAEAARARGPVTICIANAGIAESAPFHRETLDHWRRTDGDQSRRRVPDLSGRARDACPGISPLA